MKKILLTTIGLFTVAALPANAADLGRMPVKAPVMAAPVWSWTGFYIGGNVGYSWGRSDTTVTFTNNVNAASVSSGNKFDMEGIIGGGQIGYNWQSGLWVLGVETDFQGSDQNGSTNFLCGANGTICSPGNTALLTTSAPVALSFNQKLDWFGTLRGRVGWTIAPTILLYGTGGLAYGGIKTDGVLSAYNANAGAVNTGFSHSATRVGWTAGAGAEGQLVGNWTAKIEYLYVDYGTLSGTVISVGTSPVVNANYSSRITDHILRGGINYKF
jgi:outer membrane immunogenic protein